MIGPSSHCSTHSSRSAPSAFLREASGLLFQGPAPRSHAEGTVATWRPGDLYEPCPGPASERGRKLPGDRRLRVASASLSHSANQAAGGVNAPALPAPSVANGEPASPASGGSEGAGETDDPEPRAGRRARQPHHRRFLPTTPFRWSHRCALSDFHNRTRLRACPGPLPFPAFPSPNFAS